MSWSYVLVFWLGLLSWSFVLVFCLGLLSLSFLLVFCLGLLSWYFVLVICLSFCLGLLSWSWSLFWTWLQTKTFMPFSIHIRHREKKPITMPFKGIPVAPNPFFRPQIGKTNALRGCFTPISEILLIGTHHSHDSVPSLLRDAPQTSTKRIPLTIAKKR